MLRKILMAAGLAAAFSLSPQVAEAKMKVQIDRVAGGYCYYNYDPFRCGGYGYYPRPGFCPPSGLYYRDPRILQGGALDCQGSRLSQCSYQQIVAEVPYFRRQETGRNFRIKVDSYNGRIFRPVDLI